MTSDSPTSHNMNRESEETVELKDRIESDSHYLEYNHHPYARQGCSGSAIKSKAHRVYSVLVKWAELICIRYR